jgi:Chaperone for flagella basal body P-ring formation
MTPVALFALAGCIAIGPGSDRVLLRDLAPAFPGLAAEAMESTVALAPAPGVQRNFELVELRRLAARLNLPEPVRELCVVRPVAKLDPARIVAALRALMPAAEIELLDYTRGPVPEGELEFTRGGIPGGASMGVWNGAVTYAGGRRFPIWAKVRLTPDVARGDMVHVEVRSGAALIAIDAQAQASGAAGQTIPFLNPISKRRFSARIEGKGRAAVEQGPQ